MAKLKPCPFCGGKDIRKLTTRRYSSIWCEGCGGEIIRGGLERAHNSLAEVEELYGKEVVEAWNRRADDKDLFDAISNIDWGAEDG